METVWIVVIVLSAIAAVSGGYVIWAWGHSTEDPPETDRSSEPPEPGV